MIRNSVLMKIAVAFVGRHWRNLFADYNGRVQLICWLSSTNTNPYAVEEMRNQPGFEVRQVDIKDDDIALAKSRYDAALAARSGARPVREATTDVSEGSLDGAALPPQDVMGPMGSVPAISHPGNGYKGPIPYEEGSMVRSVFLAAA